MLVDCSAEPAGAHWDGKIANKWIIRNETCPDIIKLKHVRNGENIIVFKNLKKIFSVARKVMQSANCALTRRLKDVLVDQPGMLLCTK